MPGKALHGISILCSNIILYLPATSKWLYLYTKLISSNTSKIVKSHARFIPHYSSLFSVANRHKTKHSQNGVMSCHMLSTQGKEAAFARFSLNSAKKHQKKSKNSQVPRASRFHISSVLVSDSSDSPTFHCQHFGIQLMIHPCGFWTAQQLLPLFACGFPQCSTGFVWGHKNSQTVWMNPHEGRNHSKHSKPRYYSYSHSATMHLTLHHNKLVTIASKHQLPFAEWHLHPLPLLRPWTSDTLSMDIPLFLPRRNSSVHLKGWARKMDLNQIHNNFFIPGFRCFKHF